MEVFNLEKMLEYRAEKMAKIDVVSSDKLICGLNCFEPGQVQKVHAHPGADKLYCVIEGSGEFSVGSEVRTLVKGDLLHVPENIEHGVVNNSSGKLAVMIVITPNLHG